MKFVRIRHAILLTSVENPIILEQLDDPLFFPHGNCKECGQDRAFRPTFDGVKTSIDIIPEMLRRSVLIG